MGTVRKYLSPKLNRRGNISILVDMEEVYKKLDSGQTIMQVADDLGIARSTLYRKHKKYQTELETLGKRNIALDEPLEDDLLENE